MPGQTSADAVADLHQAISLSPQHLSHYQLTIEPNTLFHHDPPDSLPDDDLAWQQQIECQSLLAQQGYQQYEISAYCRDNLRSEHNLNYWQFGDYIGIGAGAHGKITLGGENRVIRRVRQRQPKAYLAQAGAARIVSETELDQQDLIFEFMLNALRLTDGIDSNLFYANTGIPLNHLQPALEQAIDKKLIAFSGSKITPTELGFRYLNDLQGMFLTSSAAKKKPFFESTARIIHN